MGIYSRALNHIDMTRVKELREEKIKRRKDAKEYVRVVFVDYCATTAGCKMDGINGSIDILLSQPLLVVQIDTCRMTCLRRQTHT